MCIPKNRLPKEPVYRESDWLVAATSASAAAHAVSAEAGDQQNPDNPFTSAAVVTAENAASAVVITSAVASASTHAVAVAEEK